jgi:tetratricopeptide (TPR) repeat protein
VAVVALVVVVGGALGAYLAVRARSRAEEVARAVELARPGLARDTLGSLTQAAAVLARAREVSPRDPAVLSLQAQVAAILAAEHGDEPSRALGLALVAEPAAGEGALVARVLLAPSQAERRAAEIEALGAPPSSAPLVQRLAGLALMAQGQVESGRGRLELAARAAPPLLGALADLGESHLAADDPEGALPYFEAALSAHPTHARAAIGAAEARLAVGQDLATSRAQLAAVETDPGSAPPVAARLRFELAVARVLAATGEAAEGARRLTLAAGRLGDSPVVHAARAEILLAAGDPEPAEEAAARAVRGSPREEDHRLLLARARLALHRDAAALDALGRTGSRAAWLLRGTAQLRLSRFREARTALERTVRDGKMPAEAAVRFALADVGLGRADRAVPLLEMLAMGRTAAAEAAAALGAAELARRRLDAAEAACRRSLERDPGAAGGHLCLGRVLVAAGRGSDAVAPLEEAARLDRWDPEPARLLEQARRPAPKAAPVKSAAKRTPVRRAGRR